MIDDIGNAIMSIGEKGGVPLDLLIYAIAANLEADGVNIFYRQAENIKKQRRTTSIKCFKWFGYVAFLLF